MILNEQSVAIVLRRFSFSLMNKSLYFPKISIWLRNVCFYHVFVRYAFVYLWSLDWFCNPGLSILSMLLIEKSSVGLPFRIINHLFAMRSIIYWFSNCLSDITYVLKSGNLFHYVHSYCSNISPCFLINATSASSRSVSLQPSFTLLSRVFVLLYRYLFSISQISYITWFIINMNISFNSIITFNFITTDTRTERMPVTLRRTIKDSEMVPSSWISPQITCG